MVVFVLGMHRSGTSCLAGTLQACGVELGHVVEKSHGNPKGTREISALWQLNERLLEKNGGSCVSPGLVKRWDREDEKDRDTILSGFLRSRVWGIKDPRLMFCLDFWRQGIDVEPTLVGTFRHPTAVAASLKVRDGMETSKAIEFWKQYNQRLLDEYQSSPFPLACFDANPQTYQVQLTRIIRSLNLNPVQDNHFFEAQHRSITETSAFPDKGCADLYAALCEAQKRLF